jgi:hypothetical protein
VKRLVDVADEMDHVLERNEALSGSHGGIPKNGAPSLDLLHHAVSTGAVAGGVVALSGERDIDEVPRAGFGVRGPDRVGPGGDLVEVLSTVLA